MTDGTQPTVSVHQFSWDHDVLDKVVGGFAVADTGYILASNAASLQNDLAHITSIASTSGPPSISVTWFLTYQSLFDKVTGGIARPMS